jgi:opacity protein-like surface antigen
MKKLFLIGVLCLSLTAAAFSMGFSIKATGGLSLLFGGDYNSAVQGQNDIYNNVAGVTENSELSKLSLGLDFGAEFILQFTPSMGVGIGAGYLHASNDSTLKVTGGAVSLSEQFVPNVSAIPFTLNFHYFLPLGSRMKLHFFAGPGLYVITSPEFKAATTETMGAIELAKLTTTFTPDTKVVFGFQGGAGIEFDMSPNFGLLFDMAGRYLSVSNITGSWITEGHVGLIPISISKTGTLYYYEAQISGSYYGALVSSDTLPSGVNIRNAREASISLSGIQFQLGIIFHF